MVFLSRQASIKLNCSFYCPLLEGYFILKCRIPAPLVLFPSSQHCCVEDYWHGNENCPFPSKCKDVDSKQQFYCRFFRTMHFTKGAQHDSYFPLTKTGKWLLQFPFCFVINSVFISGEISWAHSCIHASLLYPSLFRHTAFTFGTAAEVFRNCLLPSCHSSLILELANPVLYTYARQRVWHVCM